MDIKAINTAIIAGNFTSTELTSIMDAVKYARARNADMMGSLLKAGSKVTVSHRTLGGTVTGTVVKVKLKKAIVTIDTGIKKGSRYDLALSMLAAV
jgi:hypothetical protein